MHRKLESWEKAKEGVVLGAEIRSRAQARGRPCILPLWDAIGGASLAANTCPGPAYATRVTPVSPSTSENARSNAPDASELGAALPALSAALRCAQRKLNRLKTPFSPRYSYSTTPTIPIRPSI